MSGESASVLVTWAVMKLKLQDKVSCIGSYVQVVCEKHFSFDADTATGILVRTFCT